MWLTGTPTDNDGPRPEQLVLVGAVGGVMAIVAAVKGSVVLAGIAGGAVVALAGAAARQVRLRRTAEAERDALVAENASLEDMIVEQQQKLDALAAASDWVRADESCGPVGANPDGSVLREEFFFVTLNARVAFARRHLRPLSVVLLDVVRVTGDDVVTAPDEAVEQHVGDIVVDTLRDADMVCALDGGRYGLILEDTAETGAIWTVERIRRRISTEVAGHIVWAGVACYPAHGFDGTEVFAKAQRAIDAARDWSQDRTEVADA